MDDPLPLEEALTASTRLVLVSLTVKVATTSKLAIVSSVEIRKVAAAYDASIITKTKHCTSILLKGLTESTITF